MRFFWNSTDLILSWIFLQTTMRPDEMPMELPSTLHSPSSSNHVIVPHCHRVNIALDCSFDRFAWLQIFDVDPRPLLTPPCFQLTCRGAAPARALDCLPSIITQFNPIATMLLGPRRRIVFISALVCIPSSAAGWIWVLPSATALVISATATSP